MCDSTIRDGDLVCQRPDPHVTGHVFEASWVDAETSGEPS